MTHTTNDDSMHRARGWICTLNNYTDVELAKCISFADEKCQYACIGKEVGSTGTPHLQIYFQMKTSYSGQSIKNQTSKRMWTGIANDPNKSRKYCQKEGDYSEFGTFMDTVIAKAKGQAKGGAVQKAKFDALNKSIDDGMTLDQIRHNHSELFFKHRPAIIHAMKDANIRHARKTKSCVHVYVGPPGVGKTKTCHEFAGSGAYWQASKNGMWWDDYDGRQNIILDDFNGQIPFWYWKRLTDFTPMNLEVKGGMIGLYGSPTIFITSNSHPKDWWKEMSQFDLGALYRRIHVLKVWNPETLAFEDYQEPLRTLYDAGCICDPKFGLPVEDVEHYAGPEDATLEISSENEEEEVQMPTLDDSHKKPTLPPNPSKKIRVKLPGKPISALLFPKAKVPPPFSTAAADDEVISHSWDSSDASDSRSSDSESDSEEFEEIL